LTARRSLADNALQEAVILPNSSNDPDEPGYRDALQSYLKTIRRYKLLTQSGEYRLAVASQEGVELAKKQMVEANLRLVVHLAKEYRHTRVALEDLIAEGNLGLIEAVNRFDPDRGVRFVAYAAWWIRKYMLQAVDRQSHRASTRRPRILSFAEFMRDSSDAQVLERVADESAEDPENVALERQLESALQSVLHRLPAREREILSSHFGLDGRPPRSLKEIGREIDLTRERVRQIELRAFDRVRRLLQRSNAG